MRLSPWVSWPALVVASAGGAAGLARLGMPSASLFGALLAGLALALSGVQTPWPPVIAFRSSHAVIGVMLGAYLNAESLAVLGSVWIPVVLVMLGTLWMSLAAGDILNRFTGVDAGTAALGMVAGGASTILAMSQELDADDRLVAFMQYMRVLVVVLLAPLVVGVAGLDHAGVAPAAAAPLLGDARGWLLTGALGALGALIGVRSRVPAGRLLAPMLIVGALTLAFPGAAFDVPPILREVAFAGIGLQVGLRFTTATLRQVGRLAFPVLGLILALIAGCFALAGAITLTTSVPLLDAYLATTPGGLLAVSATGLDAGADVTFIIAVQTLRIVVMITLSPFAVRRLVAARAADP